MLHTVPEIEVVGQADSLESLFDAVAADTPDVVLTDIRMPPTKTDEGIVAAERLRTTHPEVGVLVLSKYVEPEYAVALVANGSSHRGYLLKDNLADVDQLVTSLKVVASGGSAIDPDVVSALMRPAGRATGPLGKLTNREIEVLGAVARGGSNAAIASELFITARAVEKHINSIFLKLNLPVGPEVNRRVAAVLVYLTSQHGGAAPPAVRR